MLHNLCELNPAYLQFVQASQAANWYDSAQIA
jgi:hypothetical protein